MGLDIVEFVIAVEESFEVAIPDHIAQTMTTPRHVIDYIHSQLPHSNEGHCLTQRAFYRLRQTMEQELGAVQPRLRPTTEICGILPHAQGSKVWKRVGHTLGYKHWPSYHGDRWWSVLYSCQTVKTIGDAARRMAAYKSRRYKPEGEGWSNQEVQQVIDGLIRGEFGVESYSLDDSFVDDMHLD
jgi:hypothetical protein